MSLDPLGPRGTLTGDALEAIRAAIVDGRLQTGERYSVARLAEQFGVSRTPVREALLQLERQGVVRFERNLGVRILQATAHDVEEIFTLRLLLEVPATLRAAALIDRAGLTALRGELAAMREHARAGDEARFMVRDKTFHDVVLRAAGNVRLAGMVGDLRDLVRSRGASTVGRSRDMKVIVREHRAILDALAAADAPAAAAAMRAHIAETGRLLLAQEGADVPLGW